MQALTILGLDPGSRYTGFGVIQRSGSKVRLIAEGRIVLPSDKPLAQRLVILTAEIEKLIFEHNPTVAVLESLFRGINVRSLIVLAQARGALVATVARAGLDLYEYSPAEIKAAVTGHGRADKEQVSRMVKMILGTRSEMTPDAGDALAAAICFSQRSRLDALGAVAGPSRAR